jgi:hypothetical protein
VISLDGRKCSLFIPRKKGEKEQDEKNNDNDENDYKINSKVPSVFFLIPDNGLYLMFLHWNSLKAPKTECYIFIAISYSD